MPSIVAIPPLLRDLRAVWNQPKKDDRGSSQQALRKVYEDNFPGFISLMKKEEREHKENIAEARQRIRARKAAKADQITDPGSVRIVELIEKLLDSWPEERDGRSRAPSA